MKKLILLLLILPFFFACKDDASSSSESETKPDPKPIVQGICGDGYLNEGEQCDGSLFRDKNLPDGVQCDSTCQYDTRMVQFQP